MADACVARREAEEFTTELRILGWILTVLVTLVLCSLAYFGVSLRWLFIVCFVGTSDILIELLVHLAFRLDAGRSYPEQFAAEIEPVILETSDCVRTTAKRNHGA
jgi:hypothetical protein